MIHLYNRGRISKSWFLLKIIVIISMLQSFSAWFFADIKDSVCSVVLFIILILYKLFKPVFFQPRSSICSPVLFLVACCFASASLNLNAFINMFSIGCCIYLISTLKLSLLNDFLNTAMNFMALLLFISSLGWILYLLGVNLPHTYMSMGHYEFDNYYIFAVNHLYLFDRFSSIFLEPGYVGCLCALLLFLDDYRLTWRNIVYYISITCTISLAAIIMVFIGFCIKKIRFDKKSIILLFLTCSIIFASWNWALNYNGGDNWLNNGVVMRLAFDKSTGSIAGDNRTSQDFDAWFWNSFIQSDYLLFGKGNNSDETAADWKVSIVVYGLVQFICYYLFLFSAIPKRHVKKSIDVMIWVLLYVLMFYQTSFGMYWFMYLTFFISGLARINNKFSKQYGIN